MKLIDIGSAAKPAGKAARMTTQDHAAERFELRELDEGEKQDQRNKVLAHVLAQHTPLQPLRFMSLPDQHWTFETQLDNAHRHCEFLGLQWSWMHAEKGTPWMPGKGRPEKFQVEIVNGALSGFRRDRSTVLYCHAGHFSSITNKEIGGKPEQKLWRQRYRGRTAVWLDFQSQLCREVERCAKGLLRQLDSEKPVIPVAFSVLAARDWFDHDAGRVAQLESWISQPSDRVFSVTDVWRHQSAAVPYLTVAGVLTKREQHGSDGTKS